MGLKIDGQTGSDVEEPEEVKETTPEEESKGEEEKETPSEASTEEKPAEKEVGEEEEKRAIQGLKAEEERLRADIVALRQERRELRSPKEPMFKKPEEDPLKDMDPDYVKDIEKVAKARGFVSKEEVKSFIYEQVKKDELNSFLEKHPEYKPENDPNDKNWNALQKELGLYKAPQNARDARMLLEKAHKSISPAIPQEDIASKKDKVDTAELGTGGSPKTSKKKSSASSVDLSAFDSHKVEVMRAGGWTDEEIKKNLSKLSE